MSGALTLAIGCAGLLGLALPSFAAGRARRRQQRQVANRLLQLTARDRGAAPVLLGGARRELPAGVPAWVRVTLAQADVEPERSTLMLVGAGAAAMVVAAWWTLGWIAGLCALAGPLVLAPLALRFLARRRIAVLIDGLPFYFDAIRQMLMAGSALQQALVRTSDNADPGMRRYLLPMVRRLQNGASVGDSLQWLANRLDVAELHMFALAVQANIHYGGRLSTVLVSLAQALRDRARVHRELRAATAETRVGSMVIGSLPVAAAILMTLLNPTYLPFFRDTADGHQLLMVALGLQISGVLVMRRLLRLDF